MNRQKQYRTNVQVPKVWRRLIEEEFDQRSGGLFVTGTNREVRSEKHEHPTDDPDAYYDEVREVSGTFENGVRYRLQLCSGQSNYYAGIILDTSTEVIYEDDDPMETFHDPLILDGADDCQYTLNICWTGDDPYETPYRDKWFVNSAIERLIEEHGSEVGIDLEMWKFFRHTWNSEDDRCFEDWKTGWFPEED